MMREFFCGVLYKTIQLVLFFLFFKYHCASEKCNVILILFLPSFFSFLFLGLPLILWLRRYVANILLSIIALIVIEDLIFYFVFSGPGFGELFYQLTYSPSYTVYSFILSVLTAVLISLWFFFILKHAQRLKRTDNSI